MQKFDWDIYVPLLPTCNNAMEMKDRTYDNDKVVIRNLVQDLVQRGRYPIVVMHSYGGAPGSDALEGLSHRERRGLGQAGGVWHLIFVCAYMFTEGESGLQLLERFNPELLKDAGAINEVYPNGTMKPKFPEQTMFNALPPNSPLVNDSMNQLVPFAASAFAAPTTYTAWSTIPTTYMNTSDDYALPDTYQTVMIQQAKNETRTAFDVRYAGKGHSPFLTEPSTIKDTIESVWNIHLYHEQY